MNINDEDRGGGIITCSAEFSKYLDKIAEQLFQGHFAPKREAARFAMAIGIQKGLREKRSEWKKPNNQKNATIAHLYGQFDDKGRFDFESLFEILELKEKDDDTPLQHLISEYVTGGMRYIKENELDNLDEWTRMKDDFPHLFSED